MSNVFQAADGRILVNEGKAGGTGGGVVHEFHRLATEEEKAAWLASVEAEPHIDPETPPTETAPEAPVAEAVVTP